MKPELSIAPAPELIRYLCLFHRAFVAMQRYVEDQDEDGIILMAWIADTIHNVPDMLWRYDPNTNWHGPAQTAAWMNAFPQIVRGTAAPNRIIAACEHIFSPEGATEELALSADLSDLDLAPPDQLAAHIDLFYHACLSFRWLQGRGLPWRSRDKHWAARQAEITEAMRRMANVLVQAPIGLVHWRQFDKERFAQEARSIWVDWPAGFGEDQLAHYAMKKGE
jgi:hypothetical protein